MRRFSAWRSARMLTSAAMIGVIIAGCAPQQPQQPAPSGGQAPAPTTAPAKEQVFRYPIESIKTLDPGLATDNVSNDVVTKLFDGLVELADDGTIRPMVAEKWDISQDAKTFTFTIRQNAKWSDGKPVVAGDFEYAIKRVVDPKTGSEYANTVYPIKGAKKFHAENGKADDVAVKAKDDRTLVVETEEPAAYLLSLISTWTFDPVRKDVIDKFGDKWTDAKNIVTNGPFKLTEWIPDQRLTLTRFDDYYGTKPKLNRVEMRVFPDSPEQSAQILRAYENGELDATGKVDAPPSEVDRVLKDAKLSKEVKVFDNSRATWVCVNHLKKPFDDVRVRKALGMALERDKLINQVLKQPLKPAESLVPPGIVGRNPSAWPKENLAEAKKLLADAGFPDGKGFPEFTYSYNTSAGNKAIAEYLQSRWKEALGLSVKLETMDFPVFITYRRGNKTYDSFRCSWGSDFEDPVNWYNTLFTSIADPQQQTTNWKNAKFDEAVAKAASETNPQNRKSLYEQADKMAADDYFVVPVFWGAYRVLVKPYVEGYSIGRVAGGATLRRVSLTK